jgi:hypothetical protein
MLIVGYQTVAAGLFINLLILLREVVPSLERGCKPMISIVPVSEASPGIGAKSPSNARMPGKVADLAGAPESEDEYRQRIRANLLAAAVLVVLVGAGIWLANAMVATEKAHGCYSSGEHTCSLI